jgi:sortase (surface protein transpeptidase)
VYYREVAAPFVNLAKAKNGDEIDVVMEDGTQYTYRVISNQRILLENIDMGKVIWPPERGNKEWITLITCGGQFDTVTREYFSRDIIVAERES